MEILENVSLKHFNTFGLEVSAAFFAKVSSVENLHGLLTSRQFSGKPVFVLGGGSNILLTQPIRKLVLKMEIAGIEVLEESEENVLVSVGAGVNWHQFVLESLERGWQGLENLSLIPGCVGASPIQNIGAYGVELKDVFEKLEAYEISSGKLIMFTHADCHFGYRQSVFKKKLKGQFIITKVYLRLRKKPKFNVSYGAIQKVLEGHDVRELSAKAISDAVIAIRESKLPDPLKIGNSGSFFKNPEVKNSIFLELAKDYPTMPHYPTSNGSVKLPAGWLIEQCGWKGKRVGNTGTYKNQALVLVNHGGATGQEIFDVSNQIIEDVAAKFSIRLEPEVNIL